MDNNYTDNFLLGLIDFFLWSKWLLILAFLLTMADLKFGISAAKYRHEIVKRSRAVRRTFDKIYVNYFASKGKSVRVNFLKFFGKKTDIIDIEEKEENNG